MVFFKKRRPLTALFVGGVLTVAANLPPQHGHPRSPGHAAVVHRHASLHIADGKPSAWFSDSDGPVIWIDDSYLSASSAELSHLDAALPELLLSPPVVVAQGARPETHVFRIHGPPAVPSPSRAPPLPALL